MALLEVDRLSKNYFVGGVPVAGIRDITFSINSGEFVAIMGPSGSGKSTLLHILGLLERPSAGTYRFDSQDVNQLSDDQLADIRNKEIGFVFQSFDLLPRTSVFDNVVLPLIYAGVAPDKRRSIVEEVIGSVGLAHRLEYNSMSLSGGEKQRVAIARAISNNPKMILADEPTGNLDSQSGGLVMQNLQQLNKAGHTVLLVTHESYTAGYASRILHIKDGMLEREETNLTPHTAEEFRK
ncbi:MAG: macrolide ABC transporter ATP-binding protein [Candidatus Wildermuthbacteria bacterium RIFCSPHIGHO2_02_FULL_47_17]|uniref:Macrolide ABC transporter ATP-binding protein n=1 Tax=Candidatus Wildermuthbacteria bacterium RIFCSPHIGHO2_02_FULL_47_17 TaxID=1802452 RepID=A0A1G2R381_9BACT|nr:MAG: macrolide ABC transporter ATP-binding protein [Candidatus Wildermuthbacteria bacterium RIFCSPHIGHO2_02_FULL_47_17]